jgi:hypothetical protein
MLGLNIEAIKTIEIIAPRLTAYFVEPRPESKAGAHILSISEPNPGHF